MDLDDESGPYALAVSGGHLLGAQNQDFCNREHVLTYESDIVRGLGMMRAVPISVREMDHDEF